MGKIEGKKVSTRYSSYNYIMDTVPNPVVEVDENLVINLANREALNRWPSIIEGKSFYYTIIFGENEKPEGCFVEKTFKLKKNQSVEIKTKKGEIFLCKTNYIKEKASQRVVIHIQDISEHKHMEEILRESEERFRALVETSSDWIWEVDKNGIYTYVSPKVKDLLGYEQDEVIGKTPFDLMPPEEAERMSVIFKNIISSKKPFERLENINKHKDNRLVILETSGVPIIDTNKNLLGYRGVDRDITERKQVEKALRESEEKYRSTVESIRDGFFSLIGEDLKIRYINPAAEKLLNLQAKDVIGKPMFEAFPEAKESIFEKKYREAYQTKKSLSFETFFGVKPYENWYDIRVYSSNLGISVFFQVTTERKRIEDALKKSEERYKTLVEKQGEGIGLVNEQEEFLYANPAGEHIFGVPPGTLIGRNLKDFLTDENYKIAREQTKLRQKGIKSTYEVEIIQPGGKKRTVLVTATPEFDDKKRFKNTFGIFRDISELKRMQVEILKSKKFESLGFLATGIAHDFNNLLTIILGNIELAKRRLVTENKAFKFLLKSEEAVHEAVELVQRFLIFSEDKSVMMKTESIREIILKSTDQVLSDSNIICSYEIPGDLWSVECIVDQIYYTITNLILNAKEALSNEGKIEIKASNEVVKANQIGTLKSGKYIKLTIKDYGTGISKEDLSRIFDPYFSTKDKLTEKGLGLGLTTIHSVIMKHKGYINVESEKSIGTTVEIYLPALGGKRGQTRSPSENSKKHWNPV